MNMDEQQLPPGWELAPIEEIARTATGGTPRRNRDEYYGGNIPWVKSGDLTDGVVTVAEEFITPEGLKNSNAKIFPKGAICIALYGATVGKLGVLDMDAATNQAVCGIFPHESIEPRYVFHSLRNLRTSLIDQAQGGAQPNISNGIIKQTEIPVPPLPEQRRIVAKIEALQERSGRAAKALEEVGPLLEQFRQSILAAAFSGRLTADWREKNPNVEPAQELLARIRTERRQRWEQAELAKYEAKGKQPPKDWKDKYEEPEAVDQTDLPELPDGWCWASIGELSEIVEYGSSAKTTDDSSSVPVLRMGNILDGELKLHDLRYLPTEHPEFPQLLLHVGDLLFNRTNSAELVGKTAVFKGTPSPCSFASYLIRLRVVLTDPELVAFYINSPFGRAWAKTQVSQQVGQANINGTKLKHLAIPIPPAEEQTELLRRLVAALNHARDISGKASDTASFITQLNQSILAKAFRGELVPQDPNDEPASELLARMRREREVSGNGVQGSGRKKKAAGKGDASESARPAKRSKRSSKAASATTPEPSADTSPEPARPQRRRRDAVRETDPTKVIDIIAEGDGTHIHAEVNGTDISFYTRSGWSMAWEIDDAPEEFTRPRESARLQSLQELLNPELALFYPTNVNLNYLPQLQEWYVWAISHLSKPADAARQQRVQQDWLDALQLSPDQLLSRPVVSPPPRPPKGGTQQSLFGTD